MEDLDLDWYTYLTEDFKLDRNCYKTADRVVVDCPKCGGTTVTRVNHLKAKIKRLRRYECSKCRRKEALKKARAKWEEMQE